MGGALQTAHAIDQLPLIGIDETVHDLTPDEDPTDDPLPSLDLSNFPGHLKVESEDDIIGVQAAIIYENCLRQLLDFLNLPVQKCTGVLSTGQMCDSTAPFNVKITARGTAMRAEWVSLDSQNT